MVKLAFIFGPFLVLFPILLRYINAVDNSFAFDFISIGIVVLIIAEIQRASVDEASPV